MIELLTFDIKAGRLTGWSYKPEASWIGDAYAGQGASLNNPADVALKARGPLPPGLYFIGAPIDDPKSVGEYALPLTPHPGNEMYGRGDFFIHGDNPQMNHSASDGCIVAPRAERELCAKFQLLLVVA